MARGGNVRVRIDADTRGLSRGTRSAERDLRRLNSVGTRTFRGLTSAAKISTGAVVAGLAGATLAAKRFYEASEEAARVDRQLQQVLKTTGGVANVTAKQVDALADSLSKKTGVDDELIKSNAALIATFTNVRNEAGKGNDIFTQATAAVLDMSAAFKQDGKASAIQLGKALNDPIKGVTALQRVGVSFTAQQKEQIATFVESGKTMEAQKVILAELQREVGGQAQAQATNLDRLKVSAGNLEETLGDGLRPAINDVAGDLDKLAQGAQPRLEGLVRLFNTIFTRDDLDLAGKLKLSAHAVKSALAPFVPGIRDTIRDADIPAKLGKAFEFAAPKIIDALAASAPRAASAFIRAFQASGTWGKLLTAAFIISKLGGFRAAGGWAATALAGRFKATLVRSAVMTSAGTLAGEAVARNTAAGLATQLPTSLTGRQGRIAKSVSGFGSFLGRAIGGVAVGSLIYEIAKGIPALNQYSGSKGWGELWRDIKGRFNGQAGSTSNPLSNPAGPPPGAQITRAIGGRVPGARVAADTVPAMLSPGEFVVTGGGEKILERLTGRPGVLDWLQNVQPRHFAAGGRASTAARAAKAAGFTGKALETIVAIAGPESAYNPRARLVTSREDSRGLWQINTLAHPWARSMNLYDPMVNARAAYRVYRQAGGFGPWTGYTSGAYRRFLGEASAAVKGAARGGSTTASGATAGGFEPERVSAYERAIGRSDLALAEAGRTSGTADDAAALRSRQQTVGRQIQRVRRALKNKRLSSGARHHLTTSLASLLSEHTDLGRQRAELRPEAPTALDFASADLALAGLTPGSEDDIAAAQRIYDIRGSELMAAQGTGDPRLVAEAASNLASARDALLSLKESIDQSTEAQLAYQQTLNEILKAQRAEAQQQAAVNEVNFDTFKKWIRDVSNVGVGSTLGLSFSSPSFPGGLARL